MMIIRVLPRFIASNYVIARNFSTTQRNNHRVAVVGGAGGIGAPLSLLFKLQPDLVSELHIQDIHKATPGIALDIAHICTPVKVKAFVGASELVNALKGADIVVIPGGVPRKPGMSRDDLFGANAGVVRDVAVACSEACPDALVNIITNPVNTCVPIFCEVMKNAGKLKASKIFGISTLDLVRASTFIANLKGLDSSKVVCPVVGGHSADTMVPLVSQCQPPVNFSKDELKTLINNIQNAGTHVVKAKAGFGSAQLSMAYAAARIAFNLLRAKKGQQNIIECSYTMNDNYKTGYFSSKLLLGKNGVEKDLGLGTPTDLEKELLEKAKEAIKKNVAKGVSFVKK